MGSATARAEPDPEIVTEAPCCPMLGLRSWNEKEYSCPASRAPAPALDIPSCNVPEDCVHFAVDPKTCCGYAAGYVTVRLVVDGVAETVRPLSVMIEPWLLWSLMFIRIETERVLRASTCAVLCEIFLTTHAFWYVRGFEPLGMPRTGLCERERRGVEGGERGRVNMPINLYIHLHVHANMFVCVYTYKCMH